MGNQKPPQSPPLDLEFLPELQDRIIRLKDLLRAADALCQGAMNDSEAPLVAVLQVTLEEARKLDACFDAFLAGEAAA